MRYLPLHKISTVARFGAPLAVGALLAAGCSSTATPSGSAAGGSTQTGSNGAASSSAAGGSGSAATVDARTGPDGTYLTDSAGRTLYLWAADKSSSSSCSGQCSTFWPALTTTGTPTAGSGVTASDLGTTTRADGTMQVTYMGHPLYYFVQDKNPGQMTGQGSSAFGAVWWIVSPTGMAITMPGTGSSGAPSAGTTSKAAGGWA